MRVAYVLSQNKGGLPHYAAELANAVADHADVAVLKPFETTADDVFSDDVEVMNLFEGMALSMPDIYAGDVNVRATIRGLLSYRALERVREFDPDVVHEPTDLFPHVKFFVGRYDIDREYPFVATYHEVPENPYSLANPELLAESLVDAAVPDLDIDRVVVHSDKQREKLVERGRSPDRIEVVPHGVYDFFGDYEFTPREREDDTVLFFGNVVPAKGVDVLVEATLTVARDRPNVTLVVAGDGPLSDRSRRLIDAHPEHFELHNYFVPNERVGELFSRASVVALPYRDRGDTKGHSGALATAHSFGKPVVATSTGDFPSMVGDAECGLLVPPDDPDALAAAIRELLEDDDRRERFAENSERRARELSWESLADRYVELYRDVVAEHGRRRARPVRG